MSVLHTYTDHNTLDGFRMTGILYSCKPMLLSSYTRTILKTSYEFLIRHGWCCKLFSNLWVTVTLIVRLLIECTMQTTMHHASALQCLVCLVSLWLCNLVKVYYCLFAVVFIKISTKKANDIIIRYSPKHLCIKRLYFNIICYMHYF